MVTLLGKTWRLCAALVVLVKEVDRRWPKRDKTSDGSVGDLAHRNRTSDHNPDDDGDVKAADIDEDLEGNAGAYPRFKAGDNIRRLREALLQQARAGKLPQLFYIISEGYIYSITYGFRKRKYALADKMPHDHHMHVSARAAYKNSRRPWLAELPPKRSANPITRAEAYTLAAVDVDWVLARRKTQIPSRHVWFVQAWLRTTGHYTGTVDGIWGKATETAWDGFCLWKFKHRTSIRLYTLQALRNRAMKLAKTTTKPVID